MTIGKCLSDIKTRRCGVIPYTLVLPKNSTESSQLWFLLARHRLTGELGDFGGGIKKVEKTLVGGFRELQEESRGIFSEIYRSPNDLEHCVTVIDNKADMAEIFVPVGPEWFLIVDDKFKRAISQKKGFDEMSELVWVSEETMNKLVWGVESLDLDFQDLENLDRRKLLSKESEIVVYNSTPGVGVMWKRIRVFLQKSIKSRDKLYKYLKNHSLLFLATQRTMASL